jgi:lipopolysaccharide/colanic/teichoic acid biosynthesis glycosyltransferase
VLDQFRSRFEPEDYGPQVLEGVLIKLMDYSTMAKTNASVEAKDSSANGDGVHASGVAGMISEEQFRRMLCRERKRSERSRKHLLLMLIDGKSSRPRKSESAVLQKIAGVLCRTIRETDLAGWFEADSVVGVIFTELGSTDVSAAVKIIESKVTEGLQKAFKPIQLGSFQVSFYAFPDGWEGNGHGRPVDPALYPDLFEVEKRKKLSLLTKRVMDIAGSGIALILLFPVFLLLAILIRLTSSGPVFYRQQRVRQYGVPFVFLKFRSMVASTDATIHREYVRNFIAGKTGQPAAEGNQKAVYKITNDPRVTWIGRIMRRASLDELPQFWHVLTGEMSLVGPRPPIPYEIEAYDIWHRRRLLEAKPGITGLWQVHGRSKTTFDEMVRLDLQYSRTWSPLLDLKILLQTPRAVFSGDGAY